ncbi:MAG: ribonuclease HII [Kiritimatiellia bacterium]
MDKEPIAASCSGACCASPKLQGHRRKERRFPETAPLELEEAYWAKAPGTALAGIDEAGRGPLAGPVVAAAVTMTPEHARELRDGALAGLNDSKKVAEDERERFYEVLTHDSAVGCAIGLATAKEIDFYNILRATHLAMRRAIEALPGGLPDFAFVDGLPVKGLPIPHEAIVKGDSRSFLIAAASILAKVTRDRYLLEMERRFPGYGFAVHKGYPTAAHLAALRTLGPCEEHRRTFGPVSDILNPPML